METVTLVVGLVGGTVEDSTEVLVTVGAKAAMSELVADVTDADVS